MSGRGVRSVVLGALGVALLAGASVGVFAVAALSPAAAAAPGVCSPAIDHGQLDQQTVYVGQSVTGTVYVSGLRRGCGAQVAVWTSSNSVFGSATCFASSPSNACRFSVAATEAGSMSLSASVDQSETRVPIGTVTVLGNAPPPPPPPTTAVVPPPVSSLPPVIVTAPASTASSASATPSAAKPTRTNPALKMPDSPWTTGGLPGVAPQVTATTDPTEAGMPLSNDVTHGSGGVGVPLGLLLVSVVVLAGVIGAVVRMIVAHTQADAAQ